MTRATHSSALASTPMNEHRTSQSAYVGTHARADTPLAQHLPADLPEALWHLRSFRERCLT